VDWAICPLNERLTFLSALDSTGYQLARAKALTGKGKTCWIRTKPSLNNEAPRRRKPEM